MFFDTKNEKANDDFAPIPPGRYQALCLGGAYKPTKAQTGHYLAATFVITGGPADGRKVFHNFNLENQNDVAQRIGRGQFKQLLEALGVTETLASPDDANRVISDRSVTLELELEKDKRDDKMKHAVKKFHPAGVATASSAGKGPLDLSEVPF